MVLTDHELAGPRGIEAVVVAALTAGIRSIQLRAKGSSARDTLELARLLRSLTRSWGALLLINDRLDLALAAGADGVHLGPDDLDVDAARRLAPPGFVIGYSTDDPREAHTAEAKGADYIGCGTVFPTAHKPDAGTAIGPEGVRRVVAAVGVPVIAIGGIDAENGALLEGCGASGIAVMGAVMGAGDPVEACRAFLRISHRL